MNWPALRSELRRTNYAGRTVTLAEGAAVSALLTTGTALAGSRRDALVLGAVGALGLADDLLEPRQRRAGRPVAKGLRGHLGALRSGRLTTGGAKALGIPALALLGAAAAPRPRHGTMVPADAILVAGCANLANLLDLRPGRALKAVIPAAAALAVPSASAPARGRDAGQGHPCGDRDASGRALAIAALVPAAAALLPDLREHGMLGDAGANALGAAVGLAATRRAPRPVRLGLTGLVVALTLASERVSFSAVIDRIPALRAVDRWGRRQAPSGSAEDPDA
ncbi:hypothetical protein [Brachybacterium sp. p3-SID957]|uniref:hypothetical protein n=1 Tax=Brachybacterium sp. p3-SID957 TaxID=2916049 RepID=UPI00223BAD79|nr:hypothetical protein [Brachybacterium sp. p3-SID957]MCT1776299.1 hypothetical protein [Brachybacterium sp. p3-SID957]